MALARSTGVRMIKVGGTCALIWLAPAILERPAAAAGPESRVRMKWDFAAGATDRDGRRQRVPMVIDYTERTLISPENVPERLVSTLSGNTRFWQQYLRRHARRGWYERFRDDAPDPNAAPSVARDWSVSLNNGSGG